MRFSSICRGAQRGNVPGAKKRRFPPKNAPKHRFGAVKRYPFTTVKPALHPRTAVCKPLPLGRFPPIAGENARKAGKRGGRFAASERWHGEAVTERALHLRGTGDPSPTDAIRRCCETVGDGFPIPGTVALGGSKPPPYLLTPACVSLSLWVDFPR